MKPLISYLAALIMLTGICPSTASCQTPVDRLFSFFSGSCVVLECDYTITMSHNRITGKGKVMVQDGMYMVDGSGLYICCDGESLWTLDMSAQEAYIEQGQPLAFSQMDTRFSVESVKETGEGYQYILNDKDGQMVKNAELLVSQDGAILSGVFELSDGNIMDIKVSSMSVEEKKSVTSFRPQVEFGPEWVVTDLR